MVVASRTKATVDSAVSEIVAEGGTAIGVACDVGRRDEIFAMVKKAIDAFGAVNILVNNAQGFGKAAQPTSTPQLTPLEDFDEEEWEYTFRTGALATLWGMKAVFAAREWGKYKINVNVINPAVVTDAMLGYLNAFGMYTLVSMAAIPLVLMLGGRRRA